MKSMTGFGRGELSVNGVRFRVEMSSVNRKQADVVVNLPRELVELDLAIRKAVTAVVSRGRVVVNVSIEQVRASKQEIVIDHALAEQYVAAAAKLNHTFKLGTGMTPAEVLRSPGVTTLSDHVVEASEAWPSIEKTLQKALNSLQRARKREGLHLKKDLQARLKLLRELVKEIEKAAPKVVATYRQSLHKRLEDSGLQLPLDDERLLKEIGLFAERSDISEELTRLHSHLKQFQTFLASPEPQGRAMDFLAQELNREFNTIGSKANNAGISQAVVAGKTEVEKIREQVQNVE